MTYEARAALANLISGVLAVTAATSASAQTGPTLRVRYMHSELQTVEGATAVYQRIQSAARRACYEGPYSATNRACQRELVDLAVAKLNDGTVIAMHNGLRPTQIASR